LSRVKSRIGGGGGRTSVQWNKRTGEYVYSVHLFSMFLSELTNILQK
jgi:hypothetical protein